MGLGLGRAGQAGVAVAAGIVPDLSARWPTQGMILGGRAARLGNRVFERGGCDLVLLVRGECVSPLPAGVVAGSR